MAKYDDTMRRDAQQVRWFKKKHHEPPVEVPLTDAPWGWVVVTCASIIMFMNDGIIFSFGSIFDDLVKYWNKPKAAVALVNSITYATYLICSPLASVPIHFFGFRVCSAVASVVSGLSLYGTSYIQDFRLMYLIYGFCLGFCGSVLNLSSNLIVGFYFERYRAIAASIATCGTSFGIMTFALLNNILIPATGWRLLTELHAGLSGLTYFCALSYRPMKTVMVPAEVARQQAATPSTAPALRMISLPHRVRHNISRKWKKFLKLLFDTSLLKRNSFLLLGVAGFFAYLGLVVPSVYVQQFTIAHGMNRCTAKWLISAMSLTSSFGRIAFGLVGLKFSAPVTIILAQVIAGVIACCPTLSLDPYFQFTWVAIYGFMIAATTCLRTTMLARLYGLKKLTNAFGLLTMFQGVGGLLSTPVAGLLIESYGYQVGFQFAGISLICSSLCMVPVVALAQRENLKLELEPRLEEPLEHIVLGTADELVDDGTQELSQAKIETLPSDKSTKAL